MKINLIIPPDPFLGDDKRNPPLGILYVAASAREKGYDVKVTDLRGMPEKDWNSIIDFDAEVYGFPALTPNYYNVTKLAKIINSKNPSAVKTIGGIHATALPEQIDNIFSKVVLKEGELAFLDVLNDIEKNKNIQKRFYQSSLINNLDSIPFPARDLIPYDSAYSKNGFVTNGDYTATIITSRGCIGNCSFCGSKEIWDRKVRFRSPDNVFKELEKMIYDDNIRHFKFYDDTMCLKKSRLLELCDKMKPLNIVWKAATRVDRTDPDLLKSMRDSGCREVALGIESLDQNVLNLNNKGTNLEQVYIAMKNLKEIGLESRLYFILGLPGEKSGFSKRLESFLDKTNPDAVDVSTFVPFPGSDIFKNPSEWGIKIKPNEYDKYVMTVGLKETDCKSLTFVHNNLSEEEIQEEREKCLRIVKERDMVKNF